MQPPAAALLVGSYAAFVLYIWCLPLLADAFDYNNDAVCATPASDITCYDEGVDGKTTLAVVHPHVSTACGCGQGVFGQAACPVASWGYSISGYIATPPATALMGILSTLPIAAMWLYGTGSPDLHSKLRALQPAGWLHHVVWWSLLAFQVCYLCFLVGTICLFDLFHTVVVGTFAVAGVIHFGAIGYIHYRYFDEQQEAKAILFLTLMVVLGMVGIAVFGANFVFHHTHAYGLWAAECVALTAGFAIAPAMLWLGAAEERVGGVTIERQQP